MRCFCWFAIIVLFLYEIGRAQDLDKSVKCDASLEKLSNGPLGYKKRGDRCEGTYDSESSNQTLEIRSFTKWFTSYDLESTKGLYINWVKPPFGSKLKIEAKGLAKRLYYKMDTQQLATKQVYFWPSNLIYRLGITKNKMGLTAKTTFEISGIERDVYVPIGISSNDNNLSSDKYELIVYPGKDIKEVYFSITALKDNTSQDKVISTNKKLDLIHSPKHEPIKISILKAKESGFFRIDLGVVLENGGTSNQSIWFYNTIH